MAGKNLNTPEINDRIFWRDGNWGVGVGGYIVKSSLKKVIDEIKASGENPIAIKLNDDFELEIIVEKK